MHKPINHHSNASADRLQKSFKCPHCENNQKKNLPVVCVDDMEEVTCYIKCYEVALKKRSLCFYSCFVNRSYQL